MEPQENETIHIEREAPPQTRWSGLGTRTTSAIVLIAIVFFALLCGGFVFTLLVMVACLIMMKEWNSLTEGDDASWRIGGMFYVTVPCASLIWLRGVTISDAPNAGINMVIFLMLCVWATDIGAYFTGRKIGGKKLAPTISPGKTWAGLFGGMVAAGITGGICHSFSPFPPTLLSSIVIGMMLAVISQGGDLFESWLKRRAGVKDSGTLIPGHGGLLDRIDGMVTATPIFALVAYMFGVIA